MKKYGKFFKKAALTAAICLGLSQSVWAMPSGGAVAEGTISGFAANPASGAEFTVTGGPAIINWGAFGIAPNESMSFNTAGGALLNQVTGGSMSQILGSLTQTGANPMFLVNPAGIVVGPGATINANQLVLSALAIKDQDFLSGNYNFAAASGTAGTLQILGKDTKINVSADTSERTGFFGGWGKTVEVADGVTFTLEHSILDLEAGKKLVLPIHNGSVPSIVEAGGENKASFVGSSVIGSQSHAGKLKIGGGYVNLEDSTITLQSGSVSNDVFLQARSSSDSGNVQRATDNVVVLKNANISIDGDMSIKGGKVNIQGSTTLSSGQTESNPDSIDNGPATRLEILAAQSTENGRYLMTPENTITADGLTISKAQTAHVIGGKVDLSNSKINVANTYDKDDVEIRALPGMMYTTGVKTYPILAPASGEAKDYSVTLTNTNVTLETSGDTDPSIDIGGGVVTLDGATVTLTGGNDNGINIYAVSDVTGQESNETMTATAGNLVAIKGGSTLESKGQRLEIGAGAVSVTEGSTVSADKTFIVANTQLGFDQTTNFVVSKGTKGNITIGSKSTILPSTRVLDGKIVYVDDPDNPQPQPEPQPVVVNTNLPTGGKLASGGVTVNDAAWTAGDLEDKSVMATNSQSIINWDTFNIGKGKALTFNTDGGALLNRVPNGPVSNLYGTLTQTGRNPMLLVNPAGILVGGGATIDANALVLSTLAMSDENFLNPNYTFATPDGRSMAAPVTFQKDAKVNVKRGATAYYDVLDSQLSVLGGTVEVADGVSFTVANESTMHLYAVQNGQLESSDSMSGTAGADNVVTFKGTATGGHNSDISMNGGAVNLSGATITGDEIYLSPLASASSAERGGTGTAANKLTIDKSTINADVRIELRGGKIEINDSTVEVNSGSQDAEHIFLHAGSSMYYGEDGLTTLTAATDNAITMNKASIEAPEVQILGGKVDITDSTITSAGLRDDHLDDLMIFAAKTYANDNAPVNHVLGKSITTGDAGHSVTLKNTTVTVAPETEIDQSLRVYGGSVLLDGATLNYGGKGWGHIGITATDTVTRSGDKYETAKWTHSVKPTNTIEIKGGSQILSADDIGIGGGNITMTEASTIGATGSGTSDANLPRQSFLLVGTTNSFTESMEGNESLVNEIGKIGTTLISKDSKILLNGVDVTDQFATKRGDESEPQPVLNTDLPTGGKLASGSVTVNGAMFTAGDLENESVVTVDPVNNGRQHAIINWNTFNIGTGKSLTFEMLGGPLLNRVTGGNLSSIYGTLTQRGDHPMFLVNPNGILVGKGATIDANQLVLSTLAISDATFQKDTLNDNCVLTTPTGRETPAAIQFKDGAKVSVDCFLKAFGGSVEADGVSITGKTDVKGNDADIHLLAANTVNGKIKLNSVQDMSAVADKNTISVSGSTVDSKGRVSLQGGDFNISGSDIRGKEVYLRSAENYLKGSSQDSANTAVTIKDSVIHARKDMDAVDGSVGNSFIVGGKVSIEDSEIHSIENYRGFKGWTYGENDYPTYSTGLANTVSVKNSELLSKRYVRLQGGQVSVDGGEIRSPRVQLWAESSYTGPGNSMHHIDGSGVTHLTRESGNQVTFTNSHAGSVGEFNVLGWNANITGSQVNAANVDITAVNGWKRSSSDGVRTDDYTADGTNAVAISDSKLTSTEGNVRVVAGGVAVDKSELDAARYAQLWIAGGLHLSTEGEKSVKAYEADTDNAISIANSTIHSGEDFRSSILGGKLDIKDNSTVTGSEVTLRASKSYILDGASDNEDATLTLKDSKVDADKKLFAISGKVDVDGSDLHAKEQLQLIASETNPVYKAGKANTMQIRNGSTLASEGDVTVFGGDVTMSGKSTASAGENLFFAGGTEMTMKNNVPTLTGVKETTRVSKDSTLLQGGVDVTDQFATTRAIVPETIPEEVADSYIEGMDKMAEVLEPNTTPAERQNATQKVVQEINNNSGSNLEKAAAVSGMMQAILLDDNISDSEKVALQKEIIQTFEPTKQVISEANNTVTSATQQASDAQPQQTQQQSAAVNTNAATAIPTAAEVNESPVNMGSTEE